MIWRRIAERRIEAAIQAGEFSRLSGNGLPLRLEDDSLIDPAWRLAHHVLKNAGLVPEWIEIDRQVRQGLAAARLSLAQIVEHCEENRVTLAHAVEQFEAEILRLNRMIDELNLKVPVAALCRRRLDPNRERQIVLSEGRQAIRRFRQ